MKYFQISTWLTLLATLIITGCTTVPLPKYAKVDDFVTVPVGGTKSVANSNYLKISDLQVTITDSLGQSFPANIIRLYRVYADPSSRYSLETMDITSNLYGRVYANEGQWMLQFVMPSSNNLSQIPEPGLATISITSTELNPDPDPKKRIINTNPMEYNEDLSALPFEILPGNGGTVTSEIYGAQYLSTASTILATPSDESLLVNNVGGAVFVFQYDSSVFSANAEPYAVKTSPDQNIQLSTSRKDLGGGITELTAIVLNPAGFYDDDTWTPGTSYYDGLYIALSWNNFKFGNQTVNDTNWNSFISLEPTKSYYIDLNGNVISNVAPLLTKVR